MIKQRIVTALSFAAAVGMVGLMAMPNEAQAQRGVVQTATQVCTFDNDPELSYRLELNFREVARTGQLRIANFAATRLSPSGKLAPEQRPTRLVLRRSLDGATVPGTFLSNPISGRKERITVAIRNDRARFVEPGERTAYTIRRDSEDGQTTFDVCNPVVEVSNE